MTEDLNPYASPNTDVPHQSWWSRIRGLFARSLGASAGFRKGNAIICGGIAFFIDPYDRRTLYAGSPSTDCSDERLALVAREAIQCLPDFLAEHGRSAPILDDRRLVVRIVNDYGGIFSDYSRAVEVLPAPLKHSLEASASERNEQPDSEHNT